MYFILAFSVSLHCVYAYVHVYACIFVFVRVCVCDCASVHSRALAPVHRNAAGLHAVRANRYVILPKDFEKAYKNVTKKAETTFEFYQ
jgi:hypothetical protein